MNMLGIKEIASYIPENRVSNYDRKEKFSINDHFIEKKIGVKRVALKGKNENTSDLCVKSFSKLTEKISIDKNKIEAMVVVTQNPDNNIPHTSAIVHGILGLSNKCACFDISLGCSGYVYGLSILKSFMQDNNLNNGLLITADPYSKIIDMEDKNTSLLFGDASSVTLITDNPVYTFGKFTFGTIGKKYEYLVCRDNKLYMNGAEIFKFASEYIPNDIIMLLKANNIDIKDIDRFIFHQGSKYIVDTIAKSLNINTENVAFDIYDYGNTVSSSIPIIIEKELRKEEVEKIVISGFGVGLSWASGFL